MHDIVAGLQDVLLSELLAPPRLRRIVDDTARMPNGERAYTLGEMFETLTGAIWSEVGGSAPRARTVDSFRRNLREYVEHLTQILMPSRESAAGGFTPVFDAPEDARAPARYELKSLSRRLGAAENPGALDLETRAHFAESKAKIDRALTAISIAR